MKLMEIAHDVYATYIWEGDRWHFLGTFSCSTSPERIQGGRQ